MDRRSEEDRQALVSVVAALLSLASLAAVAGALPAPRRIVLFAVLRHAADVACAFAAQLHAPVDRRLWPAPGDDEAVQLAKIFHALGSALAVLAHQSMRAAHWLIHRSCAFLCDGPDIFGGIAPRPRFVDTS